MDRLSQPAFAPHTPLTHRFFGIPLAVKEIVFCYVYDFAQSRTHYMVLRRVPFRPLRTEPCTMSDASSAPITGPITDPVADQTTDQTTSQTTGQTTPQADDVVPINDGSAVVLPDRDADLSLNATRIDASLTILTGIVPKEGRVSLYALSTRPASTGPVRVTLVRDGIAFETVELTPCDIPQTRPGILLRGESACLLQRDMATTGRIHAVCEDHLVLNRDAGYVADFDGRLDKIRNGRITGWAVDLTRTGADIESGNTAEIELLINGVVYVTRKTAVARPDVAKIYPGHPVSGFEMNIPLDDLPFATMHVAARIKGTQNLLPARDHTYVRQILHTAAPAHAGCRQMPVCATSVSIIVPIYNAPQELRECLETLLAHTDLGPDQQDSQESDKAPDQTADQKDASAPRHRTNQARHRVILSDDASPDPAVAAVLDEYVGHPGLVMLRNATNRGYTGNINHAIDVARGIDPGGDVVLLNSDTRVTPQWLELLQRCALQSPTIGTVSAVSDNAGAFSVPVRNAHNPVPPWMAEDDHARLITHTSALRHLRVPTTSGFCMYIKQAVFDDIGMFDADNFARGYGEENDFCMRAGHAGWEHAIADNVIIYHERSASFLETKTSLMDRASDMIPRMYPEYPLAVYQAFAQGAEINQTRFDIAYAQLRHPRLPRPRVAYVIGVESGGTPQTNMDLMSTIQNDYEPYLILCTTGFLRIFRIEGSTRVQLENIPLRHRVMPIAHDSDSYRAEITSILQRYGFELIHIRHLGRHGISLIRIARDLNIPVLFSLHDFYTVCPNVKLLDAENRFCGGTCTTGGKDCNVELWDPRYTPPLKHKWVKSWKAMFQKVLPLVDGLITTSPYARNLIRGVYDIDAVPFHVIPHARDFDYFEQRAAPLTADEPLRVFVPGHIVPAKGLDLIKDVKALDLDNRIEFHFAGMSKEDLSQYGIYHGPYERDAFGALVAKIRPHVGAVLSIWPETYSHTLTELWSCGVPVVTSHYGATGERVGDHGGGWAFDDMSPQAIFDFLITLSHDASEIEVKRAQVLDWQAGYGRDYSIAIMAERYKRLYHQTLRRVSETEVIVLPFGGEADAFVPTDHLRAALAADFGACHVMTWPAPTLRMLDLIDLPDVLLIRYHGEPVGMADACADLARALALPGDMALAVELAADALGDADTGADTGADDIRAARPVLAWLLDNAALVIGPAGHVQDADTAPPVDLTQMVPAPGDHARLPDTSPKPRPALLPATAQSYDTRIAQRMEAEVLPGSAACIHHHNAHLVAANFTLIDWDAMLSRPRVAGLVSLVILTFNKVGMTEKFLRSVLDVTDGKTDYEIILLDNGSKPEVRVQIEAMAKIDPRVRVVCAAVPLMFSVGCNYGASFARGEYVLFLNNDMEAIEPGWIDALIAPLAASDHLGITGARLLFGDQSVQHAGLVFSDISDLAYHAYSGADADAPHVRRPREMQAVTGACMAMRATDWAKLRGFNPVFVNGCEDVDLCLRMARLLHRQILYVPDALLLHLEGKSPGRGRFVLHNRLIYSRLWGDSLRADDLALYAEDGFTDATHTANDGWLAPQFRSVSVALT